MEEKINGKCMKNNGQAQLTQEFDKQDLYYGNMEDNAKHGKGTKD